MTRQGLLSRPTRNQERGPNTNDAKIPEAPEIGCVEKSSSIREFSKFFIREAGDPDVQERFDRGDVSRIPLHQYRIIKSKKT